MDVEDALTTPSEVANLIDKTPSQFTKTWFADGHIEAMMSFTDGSHYTYPNEQGPLPHPGSPKHYEWVWNNGGWVQTVGQNY